MKYIIEEQVVKGLMQYLSGRPYSEVAAGIQALGQLKPIEEKKETKK